MFSSKTCSLISSLFKRAQNSKRVEKRLCQARENDCEFISRCLNFGKETILEAKLTFLNSLSPDSLKSKPVWLAPDYLKDEKIHENLDFFYRLDFCVFKILKLRRKAKKF